MVNEPKQQHFWGGRLLLQYGLWVSRFVNYDNYINYNTPMKIIWTTIWGVKWVVLGIIFTNLNYLDQCLNGTCVGVKWHGDMNWYIDYFRLYVILHHYIYESEYMKECLKRNGSIDPYGLSQGRVIAIKLLYLYFLQLENILSYISNLLIDKYGKYFMILLRHPLY